MRCLIPFILSAAFCVPGPATAQAPTEQVKRGEYLVTMGLCHDCHTPLVMGPNGPGPDMTRALSGHPQDIVVTAPATLPSLGAWQRCRH